MGVSARGACSSVTATVAPFGTGRSSTTTAWAPPGNTAAGTGFPSAITQASYTLPSVPRRSPTRKLGAAAGVDGERELLPPTAA